MTVSEFERLGVKKRPYNGMQAYEIAKCPVPVKTVSAYSQNEKHEYVGTFTIDRTEGSYQYPDEVQFVLWTRNPPTIRQRVTHDGYYRVEICVPRVVATKMLEQALKRLWALPGE